MSWTFSDSTVKYTALAWPAALRGTDLTVCWGIEIYRNSGNPSDRADGLGHLNCGELLAASGGPCKEKLC